MARIKPYYHATADGNHPFDVHVGEKLRAIRKSRGFSQSEVGKRLGITFQQIQKYENGKNRVSCSRLYEFCQIFAISLCEFFDEDHYHLLHDAAKNAADRKLLSEVLALFSRIKDPKQQAQAIDILKLLAS